MTNSVPEQINALSCAIAVIQKTDGGYTQQEKDKAFAVLETMLASLVSEYTQNES